MKFKECVMGMGAVMSKNAAAMEAMVTTMRGILEKKSRILAVAAIVLEKDCSLLHTGAPD